MVIAQFIAPLYEGKNETHQFRYTLSLLALTLFVVALVVYSQEDTVQSGGEPDSLEDSSEKSPSLKTQGSEPETEEQSPEPEHSSDASQGLLKSPFLIYSMVAAFIVLVIVTAISHVIWNKRLQGKVDAGKLLSQAKLTKTEQEWGVQLQYVNQQSKDNTQKLEEMVSNHSAIRNEQENFQNGLSALECRVEEMQLRLTHTESGAVPDTTIDVEAVIQEAQTRVESLAQIYENGEPIDFIEIDNPTPSQKALTILNWIARTIKKWKNELEQCETGNLDLIQTLEFANQAIKDKLKEVRGVAPPLPEPLNPDTDVSTDTVYNEFKNRCTAYVSRYEGVLIGYQLGRQTADADYNQFIPQFIKDRLFNGVARYVKFDQLPKQVDEFLQIVGYEVVPIELGKTKADARLHEIQSSRQANAESGTIVDVVLPGLQRKADGEIVQKPVVIRGE